MSLCALLTPVFREESFLYEPRKGAVDSNYVVVCEGVVSGENRQAILCPGERITFCMSRCFRSLVFVTGWPSQHLLSGSV